MPETGPQDEPILAAQARFVSSPLASDILVNSVPKCGTMLLRNVVYMFVPREAVYLPFVVNDNLSSKPIFEQKVVFTGHVNHDVVSRVVFRDAKHLIIVRDPYDYVLAQARFMFSKVMQERTELARFIATHSLSMDDVVPLMIAGIAFGGNIWPSVGDMFARNALSWTDRCHFVKYEELRKHANAVETAGAYGYFASLLAACGLEMPSDWQERVEAGADRGLSDTASDDFDVRGDRNYLIESEKALFASVAPKLREVLGYWS
jgi:Sulfotransferase domain